MSTRVGQDDQMSFATVAHGTKQVSQLENSFFLSMKKTTKQNAGIFFT
jgi:hypothetical protein